MRARIKGDFEVLIGHFYASLNLERHRSTVYRLDVEREDPLRAGLGKPVVYAVAIVLKLLGDFDSAFCRHDLDEEHHASEAVVALRHLFPEADNLADALQATEGSQAKGAAIAVSHKTIRVRLVVVRTGNIFCIPTRNRNVASFAKLQISAVDGLCLKVIPIVLGAACHSNVLATLAVEPGLAISARSDGFGKGDISAHVRKARAVLRNHDFVHNARDG